MTIQDIYYIVVVVVTTYRVWEGEDHYILLLFVVNVFNIIQIVRNSGIHLKIVGEQYIKMVLACATCQSYGSQILLIMHSV